MKKIFAFLAAGLFLTACSSDDVAAPEVGSEQEVTLTFQLPEAIASRAANGGSNSALGGASNCSGEITFTAALYYGEKEVWSESASTSVPNANASVTFKPTLVIGENYKLVAYAQLDGEVVDLTNVTEPNAINDETVDAYYVSTMIKAQPSMSATLKRATGKLRIIAEDFNAIQEQLGKTISSVNVTYRQAQPTSFNPTTGNWSSTASDVEFSEALTSYTTEGDAKTILVDYIPATVNGEIVNIESVVVTFNDGTTFVKDLSTLDIPVKRNYLTTLRGNFFTAEMELTLQIDDAFEAPEIEVSNDVASAFANGGHLVLSEDITIDETLVLAAGKTLVLDLNGKTITNKVGNAKTDVIVVEEGANLTINGEGNVTAVSGNDGYTVIANGVVTINGGNFSSGLDATGDGNAVIYARGNGEIYINGGNFQNNGDKTAYVINKKDGDRATTTISIKGGTYVNFNPANNAAEGAGTNFVAEGYVSEEVSEGVWTVKFNSNIVSDVTLAGNVLTSETIKIAEGLTFDGAGYTLSLVEGSTAQYALQPKGGVIKNLTIEGYNTRNANGKVLRGIYLTPSESVTIDNVHISGVAYPLNTGSGVAVAGKTLTVTNSTLEGWTSFSGGFESASFTNCVFAASNYFDATANAAWNCTVKPYVSTVFTDCAFDLGFHIDLSEIADGESVKLVNCTVNGKEVTKENVAELLVVTGEGLAW